MGNEYSSPRRDEDGDTIMSGVSGWSYDRDKFKRSIGRSRRDGDDGPTNFIDAICGRMVFDDDDDYSRGKSSSKRRGKSGRRSSRESEDYSDDDDDTYNSEGPKERDSRRNRDSKRKVKENRSLESDYSYEEEQNPKRESKVAFSKKDSMDAASPVSTENVPSFDSNATPSNNATTAPPVLGKPLASAFAKRCYFTKAGIGPLSQHYEGVTLTGNTVLMLASAMKLKGCPTICDEDLRRVEQVFPNQFSRLPDELLLSSGWRRISKHCHFSGKPIPDGMPFFHSKERLHPQTGGFYFLVASSLGMERPDEIEPLTIDMLILLQTDFPDHCDQAPKQLLEDPASWTVVNRFCFFSGGPINAEEDVYYEAEFDGNKIYMLAFLSPNLTPEELYRLNDITGENALKSVAAVEEVDQVYNLTERDFEDLKLYHLGPCRALPSFLLTPEAWIKVLPNSFVECREKALARAYEFESHAQEAIAAAGKLIGNGSMNHAAQDENGYVEFHKGQDTGPGYQTETTHNEIEFDGRQLMNKENHLINEEDQLMNEEAQLMNSRQDSPEGRPNNGYAQYNNSPHSRGSPARRKSNHDSKSPVRQRSPSPSMSPPHRAIEEDSEEFPDPEVMMAELDDDSEFPENEDIDNIGEVTPLNDIPNKAPVDEAEHYGSANPDESYYEQDSNDQSKYHSIGIGSKTPSDDEDEMHFESKAKRGVSPVLDVKSSPESPERKMVEQSPEDPPTPIKLTGIDLQVDAHVNEIIDVPDPSPKLDLVSPMSVGSTFGPTSPASSTAKSQNSYTKSSAMRGAQKLLKKNRQQRLAIMAKRRSVTSGLQEPTVNNVGSSGVGDTPDTSTPTNNSDAENDAPKQASTGTNVIYSRSRGRSVTPVRRMGSESSVVVKETPLTPPSKKKSPIPPSPVRTPSKVRMSVYKSASARIAAIQDNDELDDTTSEALSGTSSVWTDATDGISKDSRRALILKMAKRRMKEKKSENQ